MKLDTYLQFDFLLINITKCEDKQSYKDEMASHIEAYFNDQRLKQAMKTQSYVRSILYDLSSISIKDLKKSSGAKRKKPRIEYYKNYRRQSRQNPAFKANETIYIKENQRDLQERMLCLNSKKLCIRRNQSNQPEKKTCFQNKRKRIKAIRKEKP